MNKKPLCFTATAFLLVLVVSACAAPSGDPYATITALAATIRAQGILIPVTGPSAEAPTLTPNTLSPSPTIVPSPTMTLASTLTLTPTLAIPTMTLTSTLTSTLIPALTSTPTLILTPTLVLTPSVPMVTVSVATNCRSGPDIRYDLLGILLPGQAARVIGRYSTADSDYWVILNPSRPGNTCWLWGQYATVSGNINDLPILLPPPTPTLALPAAPRNFTASVNCAQARASTYNVHVELSWTDMAGNETGFYLYRNNKHIQTLEANSTYTSDNTTLPIHKMGAPIPRIQYKLQAFNGAGVSIARQLVVMCPDLLVQ